MTRCTLLAKRLLLFAMLIATKQFVYSQELPILAPTTQTAPQGADLPTSPRPQLEALWQDANRLKSERKFAAAAVIGERILAIERDWLGDKNRRIVMSMEWLANVYQAAEDLPNCKQKLQEILKWRNAQQGEEHWETKLARLRQLDTQLLTLPQLRQVEEANRLSSEVEQLRRAGRLAEAIELAQRMSDLRRDVLGEMSLPYANSLSCIGGLYASIKDYGHAELSYLRDLEIRKVLLGESHPFYATSLNNLGFLYSSMKDYTRAETYYLQALVIRKKVLGEAHPDCVFSLIQLGVLYESMGDYVRAEPFYLQALEIRKRVPGEAHPDYATSLKDVGALYEVMRVYTRAEPYYIQAMEIRKKVLGETHPDYVASLSNLGSLYLQMKDYARAEPFLRQALEIRKKVRGETHPDYAESLNGLGLLYWSMKDYARAEPLYLQATEIIKKAFGEEDRDFITCLNNLGMLYSSMEDYSRAEPYLLQAMEIRKKILDEKHPDYARSLNNLGILYFEMRDYARAERFYGQAVEIWQDFLGQEHPDYPMGLNNLGTLYSMRGDYVRAEPLLRQALEIWKKTIGTDHIDVALAQGNLGMVLLSMDRRSEAESELKEAARIGLAYLQQTFSVQTERQKLILLEQVRVNLDCWLSVAPAAAVAPATMYDRLLLWKGIVFVEQQRQQLLRSDPRLTEDFAELESLTRQLAATSFAVPKSEAERQQREQQVQALTEGKEQIERQLAQQSADFRRQQQTIQMTSKELFSVLPQNAALVDFIVYIDFSSPKEGETEPRREQRLLAFVVRSNSSIQRIDMGPIGPMDVLIDEWRKQSRYPVGLLGEEHPGVALRKLVWEPLEASLAGAETVLISPDGPLCRFPFAALLGQTPNTFLIEERALAVIPVPQLLPQLLASTATNESPLAGKESLLLVGAVDYGGSPGASGEERGSEPSVSLDELERSAALPKYGFLGQTREEIDQLQESFEQQFPHQPVAVLDGELATEAAFRQQASDYRWLHLATHGFFAPARLRSALSAATEERSLQAGEFNRATVSGFNPGLLSGIVLTGANTEPTAGEDDGILTALEVAALDLSKVDLAVLSACETGLGEEAGGEGVLGLQRAFQLAGARTVVSSLWRVPDRQTSLLMQRFYHNVWQGKMSRIEALREAQIWILRGGDEVERAEVPPSQWAAFVLSGDWR